MATLKALRGGKSGGDGTKPAKTVEDYFKKRDLARRARRVFERDWMLNLAYMTGNQYVRYAMQTNRLIEQELPNDQDRCIENICLKITRKERAKILKTLPTPQVLPATDSEDDEAVARVLNNWHQWLMDSWGYERRMRTAIFWTVATGNAFLKWYWDPAEKKPCLSIVPPFDLYVDPYPKDMSDCRWVIHTNFMDIDAAKQLYGKIKGANLDAIQETSTEPMTSIESRIYANWSDGMTNLPGVIAYEYWEKPHGDSPGEYTVFTAQGIVWKGEFPYEHGRLPFTHIGHIERSNSKYYASIMDVIRPIQDEINRTANQLVENRNFSQGKWFIPAGLELEADPTSSAREILKAVGGSAPNLGPQFIQTSSLPAWVVQEIDRQKAVAEDIAGQHEVSNGQVPGRVDAAQAIQLLQESDDDVINDTIHSVNEAVKDGFYQVTALQVQYGDPETVVRTYDRDGNVEVRTLYKDRIDLDFHIDVDTTTGLPKTIAGRWDRVLNLWDRKIIQDPNRILELLDLAPETPDLVPDMLDRKVAYRENVAMAGGQALLPRLFDNHMVHIAQHQRYMKTEAWEQLDPINQKKFEFHVERHQELQLQVASQQAELQHVMQGGPLPPAAQTGAPQSTVPATQPAGPPPPQGGPPPGGPPGGMPAAPTAPTVSGPPGP